MLLFNILGLIKIFKANLLLYDAFNILNHKGEYLSGIGRNLSRPTISKNTTKKTEFKIYDFYNDVGKIGIENSSYVFDLSDVNSKTRIIFYKKKVSNDNQKIKFVKKSGVTYTLKINDKCIESDGEFLNLNDCSNDPTQSFQFINTKINNTKFINEELYKSFDKGSFYLTNEDQFLSFDKKFFFERNSKFPIKMSLEKDGILYKIKENISGKYLDISNDENISFMLKNDIIDQLFSIELLKNENVLIKSSSTGKCLSRVDGENSLQFNVCNGSARQEFKISTENPKDSSIFLSIFDTNKYVSIDKEHKYIVTTEYPSSALNFTFRKKSNKITNIYSPDVMLYITKINEFLGFGSDPMDFIIDSDKTEEYYSFRDLNSNNCITKLNSTNRMVLSRCDNSKQQFFKGFESMKAREIEMFDHEYRKDSLFPNDNYKLTEIEMLEKGMSGKAMNTLLTYKNQLRDIKEEIEKNKKPSLPRNKKYENDNSGTLSEESKFIEGDDNLSKVNDYIRKRREFTN